MKHFPQKIIRIVYGMAKKLNIIFCKARKAADVVSRTGPPCKNLFRKYRGEKVAKCVLGQLIRSACYLFYDKLEGVQENEELD